MKYMRYEKKTIYITWNWKLHCEISVVIVQVLVLVLVGTKDHSQIRYQSDF